MTVYDFSGNTRLEKHKPKRSGVEKGAESMVKQDRASRDTMLGKAGTDLDTAQGTLSQFEGPIKDSPYYKSLLATSTDATSGAYENAKASAASRAKMSGFGYSQPAAQEGQTEVGAREAGDLARLPAEAYGATADKALRAAEDTTRIGSEYGTMGGQLGGQALGYETGAVVPLEEDYMKRRQSFTNRMWNIGAEGAPGMGGTP